MDFELPDGTTLSLADGATGADAAAAIGPGLARAALAIKVDGELRDLARPLPDDDGTAPRASSRSSPSQRRGGPPADPPRRRARARRRDARALSGREDLDRPADRGRLLLRLRLPRRRRRQRRGLPADRGEDARAHRRRRAVRARGRQRARTRSTASAAKPALQGRADRGPDQRTRACDDGLALHQRPVHRPVPRPARPEHQAHQGVQAAVGRRRVLARGRQPPMLTRVYGTAFFSTRTSRSTWSGSSGRAPTTTAGSAAARAVHVLRARAGLGVLAARRAPSVFNSLVALCREMGRRARLHRGQDPACSSTLELWKTSGHWDKYRDNMFVTESRTSRWR